MNLPKTVSVRWMRTCKVGESIICEGHTDYCRTPLVKADFKHKTQKAWLCFASTKPPQPVTVITIIEFPKEPTWTSNI